MSANVKGGKSHIMKIYFFLLCSFFLTLSSCQNLKSSQTGSSLTGEWTSLHSREVSPRQEKSSPPPPLRKKKQKEVKADKNKEASLSESLVLKEDHRLIDKWITYFKTRGREYMQTYLGRSSRYMPLMKKVLKKHQLPEDLVYVAMIESGFSPQARSYANAVGYWQFIEGTAKRYGLKVNSYVDERRDPVLSTDAAARYFKDLYGIFGSWDLALASYNAGEYRINRAVMRHYTRDFWYLAAKRSFPRETINYVPKFVAAVRISKNPEKYGFRSVSYQPALEYEDFTLTHPISLKKLATRLSISYQEVQKLNPRYRGEYVPFEEKAGGTKIRIPKGTTQALKTVIAQCEMKRPLYAHFDYFWYRVRRGDNLYRLARRNKTTISTIRRMNKMTTKTILRAGRKIKLPSYNKVVRRRTKKTVLASNHRVLPGESLSSIAKKYRVQVKRLKALNGLTNPTLHPGQVLTLVSPPSKIKFHIVQRGETLIGIAKKYQISLPVLMKLNSLTFQSILKAGAKLKLPAHL